MLAVSLVVQRRLVAAIVSVLALGLILAVVIALPPAANQLVAAVSDVDATLREADFAFVDHELAYAGDYGLSPGAALEKGKAFAFADHELMYAGGYGLSPASAVENGPEFEFVDHELRYGSGYRFVPAGAVEKGSDSDSAAHAVRYARGSDR